MTYCVAWKKDDKVFLIADSVISSFENNADSEVSSFGEKQGLYNSYYVHESTLKIIKINESMAICYSGDKKNAEDAIDSIFLLSKYYSVEQILDNLKSNYEYGSSSFELIILCYENENKIYYFKGNKYSLIEEFIDIGSGKDIPNLSESLKSFIYGNYKLSNESGYHLASVVAYIQCISKKNCFYNYGVGGAFFGLYIDKELTWCKDIHYYIYNNDPSDFNSISVISRYDGIYSASGYNSSIKYYYNQGSNPKVLTDIYTQEGIIKSLNTSFPDYFVFFSTTYNTIYIVNIAKWGHNTLFRMWIRRCSDKTKFAFVFNPIFSRLLVSNKNEKTMFPNFINVNCNKEHFMPREEFINKYINNNFIDDLDDKFDYDLRQYKFEFNYANFNSIHSETFNFKNLIILDYNYFCERVSEKYKIYKQSGLTIDLLDFTKLIEKFLPQIASDDFNDYGLYVIKDSDDSVFLDEFSIDEWFKTYDNCRFIVDLNNNYKKELAGIVFETIKNYYFDETYFHLDKVIIGCDDTGVNEVLSFVPIVNFEESSPDILLMRNFNSLTVMDGRFRYIVMDYAIGHMFGLNLNQIGLLESGFPINM